MDPRSIHGRTDILARPCRLARGVSRAALLALCLSLVQSNKSAAKTFIVEAGTSTVQDVMLQAVSGDSLVLLPGIYPLERGIVMKGGITLRSQDGPLTTILSMDTSEDVGVFLFFNVQQSSTIEGVTIAHGAFHTGTPGGGITIRYSSPVIENNLIIGNINGDIEGNSGVGCGIGIEGGAPVIRNNTIVANTCEYGGVDLYRTRALIEHNIIAFTSLDDAPGGEGISCTESPAAYIRENVFWGNQSSNIGPSCATLADGNGNVIVDPLFCNPVLRPMDPLLGDWGVSLASPVAPGGAYGGWGAGLGICAGSTPTQPRTWGSIKAGYR
jgi:hypothetical protein